MGVATKDGTVAILVTSGGTFVVAGVPKLTVAVRLGSVHKHTVILRLFCTDAAPCQGVASVDVARDQKVGKRTVVTYLALTSTKVSFGAGTTKTITLKMSARGLRTITAHALRHRFAMTYVSHVIGASRGVLRVWVP